MSFTIQGQISERSDKGPDNPHTNQQTNQQQTRDVKSREGESTICRPKPATAARRLASQSTEHRSDTNAAMPRLARRPHGNNQQEHHPWITRICIPSGVLHWIEPMAGSTQHYHAQLTDRDCQVFRGLFESRIMTVAHVAALYFAGHADAARKRLWKLQTSGYINQRPRNAYDPAIYVLTAKSFRALTENHHLEGFPKLSPAQMAKRAQVSEMTIRHELAVMDVKAAFVSAVAKLPHLQILEFNTWPRLSQFVGRPGDNENSLLVRPDGFIRIATRPDDAEQRFFLEVDRSTETLDNLATRMLCYRHHHRSGGFAERLGHPREQFMHFPLRVLAIFKTQQRQDNFARHLLSMHPPILSQVWSTTLEEVCRDAAGAIWLRPVDYRNTLQARKQRLLSSNDSSDLN